MDMELDEMKSLWLANDSKIEKILRLNEQTIELIQNEKAKKKLAPLYWQRIIEFILHTIAIVLLTAFLYENFFLYPYNLSAVLLLAFYLITFSNALKQIIILEKIDYGKDLAAMQKSVALLQINILNYARLSVLLIPTFLAYPVVITKVLKDYHIPFLKGFDIIAQSNGNWPAGQLIASVILVPLGLWFYKQVSYKNVHKEWVRNFIRRSSGTRVIKAMGLLNEVVKD